MYEYMQAFKNLTKNIDSTFVRIFFINTVLCLSASLDISIRYHGIIGETGGNQYSDDTSSYTLW